MQNTFLALLFLGGIAAVCGAGEDLECYDCWGYDSKIPAHKENNNANCPGSNWDASQISSTKESPWSGVNFVCGNLYISTPSIPADNNQVTIRLKMAVNETIKPQPTSAELQRIVQERSGGRLGASPTWMDPNGNIEFSWCSTNLCNSGPLATPSGTVLMATALSAVALLLKL